jgi:hypothetical protein
MRQGIARIRHLLHRHYERLRKSSVVLNFIAERVDSLGSTGDAANFTANATTDELAIEGHGLLTGDGPFALSSSGTLPAPLTATQLYFVKKIDNDHVKVAVSKKRAVAGTTVNITTTGTGTHTLTTATSDAAMFERLKSNKPVTVAAATDVDDLA